MKRFQLIPNCILKIKKFNECLSAKPWTLLTAKYKSHLNFKPTNSYAISKPLNTFISTKFQYIRHYSNYPKNINLNQTEAEYYFKPIVKVYTTSAAPNYAQPWQSKPHKEMLGSGFVVANHKILTNAHVVANHTLVMVRKFGSPTRYVAKVKAIGHECDIAVLEVEENDFWEDVHPLEFGGIPELQDNILVVGYPTGGDNISVTGGVVSRIEMQQYTHGAAHLLCIQCDAAINPGNSGGPVLQNKKVVGIAFQHLSGAEGIGYIIPVPIIQRFLKDVEVNEKYTGFCHSGYLCQPMENPSLRKSTKMRHNETGVLVTRVNKLAPAAAVIQKDDVLLSIDGEKIANDGTIIFRNNERIFFEYLISLKFSGEKSSYHILRDGKRFKAEIVYKEPDLLVPYHLYDRLPSYFIYGGLVFTVLTQPYLHEFGDDWFNASPRKLSYKAIYGIKEFEDEEVVIISHVLADQVNIGYGSVNNIEVQSFNGKKIRNLKQLVQYVEGNKESSARFDCDEEIVIILDSASAKQASVRILQRHRIPSEKSEDL